MTASCKVEWRVEGWMELSGTEQEVGTMLSCSGALGTLPFELLLSVGTARA